MMKRIMAAALFFSGACAQTLPPDLFFRCIDRGSSVVQAVDGICRTITKKEENTLAADNIHYVVSIEEAGKKELWYVTVGGIPPSYKTRIFSWIGSGGKGFGIHREFPMLHLGTLIKKIRKH